jgi:hypothetical protein
VSERCPKDGAVRRRRWGERSNMALVWLVEHGCFSKERLEALKDRYEEARAAMRAMLVPSGKTSASATVKTRGIGDATLLESIE